MDKAPYYRQLKVLYADVLAHTDKIAWAERYLPGGNSASLDEMVRLIRRETPRLARRGVYDQERYALTNTVLKALSYPEMEK
jgi:hypothetical protein